MVKVTLVKDRVRLNLTANVGRGQPNQIEDVELVRFGYYCARINPSAPLKDMKVELAALKPNGAYGPDLEKVIIAHQKSRGGTQDGHVSPEKPNASHGESYDGKHSWIIAMLNNNMIDVCTELYPRLDLHQMTGLQLSKRLRHIFMIDTAR